MRLQQKDGKPMWQKDPASTACGKMEGSNISPTIISSPPPSVLTPLDVNITAIDFVSSKKK